MQDYEHKDFHNIQKIGRGGSGEVYRANWKNLEQYFVLKSFNIDDDTAKEVIHEVITNIYTYIMSFI